MTKAIFCLVSILWLKTVIKRKFCTVPLSTYLKYKCCSAVANGDRGQDLNLFSNQLKPCIFIDEFTLYSTHQDDPVTTILYVYLKVPNPNINFYPCKIFDHGRGTFNRLIENHHMSFIFTCRCRLYLQYINHKLQ